MQNILSNEIQQQQQQKVRALVLSVAIVCVCVGWFSLSNAQDSVSFGLFFAFVSEIWHLIAVVRAHHEYESTDIHIYRMFIYIYQLKESIRIYIYILCFIGLLSNARTRNLLSLIGDFSEIGNAQLLIYTLANTQM